MIKTISSTLESKRRLTIAHIPITQESTPRNLEKTDHHDSMTDNSRKWKVIEEPFMFIDPYEAYEKRERQIEQGIRLYKILPTDGSGKPRETEILKLI